MTSSTEAGTGWRSLSGFRTRGGLLFLPPCCPTLPLSLTHFAATLVVAPAAPPTVAPLPPPLPHCPCNSLRLSLRRSVSLFETTIRELGGLLSAYELSKEQVQLAGCCHAVAGRRSAARLLLPCCCRPPLGS